jgi:HEAT repeat protein
VPVEVRYWLSRLDDADSGVRRKAADELGDRGAESVAAVPSLMQALEDPVGSVRREVVDALGDIARRTGPETARDVVAALAKVLRGDAQAGVRKDAARSLEGIGQEAAIAVLSDVLRAVTGGLADHDVKVREEAVEALGKVLAKSERNLRFLRFRLERQPGEEEENASQEALRGMLREFETGVTAASEALVPLYRRHFGDDREEILETLGRAFGAVEVPGENLVTVFAEALGDRDEDVRNEAADVLREVGRRSGGAASRRAVVEALERGYGGGDVRVRREIVDLFDDLSAHLPAVVPLLASAARDTDAEIRESAIDTLGDIGRRAAREGLELADGILEPLAAALEDPHESVREEAADALGDMGALAGGAVPALLGALDHPEPSTRRSAIDALGTIARRLESPDAELVAALARSLEDPDDDVREEAAEALGRMGAKARAAAEALRRAARDRDRSVRRSAERALRRVEGS